jgi:hypothetical protein
MRMLKMKLTIDQILEKWQEYTSHTQRIQELKDLLLDLKTVYVPEDLDLNEKKINEIITEIKVTYQERMLPILKEILAHVDEYRTSIADILRKEKDESVVVEMEEFLANLKAQIKIAESANSDISKLINKHSKPEII